MSSQSETSSNPSAGKSSPKMETKEDGSIGSKYRVVVVKTGMANTGSMLVTLKRCGATDVILTNDPQQVLDAKLVVVPGVSSFGSTMEYLNAKKLVQPLKTRIEQNLPTFLVCIGLQILAEKSEESDVPGLGVVQGVPVVRFPPAVRVPQQSWNVVEADSACRFLKTGNAYFSNSYCMRSVPLGWHSATSEHGVGFVAALERGKIVATQFHPELSGAFGLALLKRWIISSLGLVDPPRSAPFFANTEAVKRHRIAAGREMLHRVIPCLDVRDGRVVKGVKFSGLKDAGDPVQLALEYERQGADELVMLDITATNEKREAAMETVKALSACLSIPLTVGGGVRSLEDAKRLLQSGADKVAINTAAVRNPKLLTDISTYCGSQCVVVAIDAVQIWSDPPDWEVVVSAGKEKTGISVVDWAAKAVCMGAGEILLTSFDRDGTKSGYDLALLKAVTSAVNVPVIASGGASTPEHMADALKAGADAVLAASIFHYGEVTVDEIKRILGRYVPVRQVGGEFQDELRDPWLNTRICQNMQCLVPSIDLMSGHAVQLVGGDPNKLEVDAGDPEPIAQRFRLAGEVAVIDLDAALGRGSNEACIRKLLKMAKCRVGGGIRSVERARQYLNWGAQRVILGTAARPEILKQLPRDRVIVALDARHGEVVVNGWRTKTGKSVEESIKALKPYAGGFLVTFVEREGRMKGIDLSAVHRLATLCSEGPHEARLCVAGGITTTEELRALDRLGVEGQVGMSLYTGRLPLADAMIAPLRSERPDGLVPTVVCDEQERCLGLVYSSPESISAAVRSLRGVYWSRKRGLWEKGKTSGAYQELLAIHADCDRDALQFIVRQKGVGFCHLENYSCFGHRSGLAALAETVKQRVTSAPEGSYTRRLLNDPQLLRAKLVEEAHELGDAETAEDVAAEAADVLYFAMVKCAKAGVSIPDVERVLDLRALKVDRRLGNAKPQYVAQVEAADEKKKAASKSAAAVPEPEETKALKTESPSSQTQAEQASEKAETTTAVVEETGKQVLRRLTRVDLPSGRRDAFDAKAGEIARNIVKDVSERGFEAVLEYAVRFGDLETPNSKFVYHQGDLEASFRQVSRETRQLLVRTHDRIQAFAQMQRESLHPMRCTIPGGRAGHSVAPVPAAGCYAPGGRYPLPSSVIMTAATARVAGCASVWVASPRPTTITLAAAHVAGADGLLAIGGAQAIAALAYGIRDPVAPGKQLIPACDVVVGPGNRFVTAAKAAVCGRVRIEGLAGPSELLVVADKYADPRVIAADLVAQAEHDPLAMPILVALDEELVDQVDTELVKILKTLPTAKVARMAFENQGAVLVASSIQEAAEIADHVAPEHLELQTQNAHGDAHFFQHYGALFVGSSAAEVLGDYGAGPNHTLPTGGTARSSGGLSVLTFLRVRTFMTMEEPGSEVAQQLVKDAEQLALIEGLHGHATSARLRLSTESKAVIHAGAESDSNQEGSGLKVSSSESESSSDQLEERPTTASDSSVAGNEKKLSGLLTDPTLLPPPSHSPDHLSRALSEGEMRMAIAKGRMFDNVATLLREAGVDMNVGGRNLRPSISMPRWSIKLLKPRDVVRMLQLGTRDVGFAGTDLLKELDASNVVPYYDTGLDPVRVVVAAPKKLLVDGHLPTGTRLRVATEYKTLTMRWIREHNLDAVVVHTHGSTEVFPPDDADIIVDNTATGSTLRANELEIIDVVCQSSTHVCVNRSVLDDPAKKLELDNFVLLLKAAINARKRVLVEFNISAASLDGCVKQLPSLRYPTVSNLYGGQGFAVRSAIPNGALQHVIPMIRDNGGTDIIVTEVKGLIR